MGSLKKFVPEDIYESPDSSIFIQLFEKVYNEIKILLAEFPNLADVDNVSEIFLPKLAQIIKYSYNYEIDIDIQREIIKRVVETYRRRGTDDSIIMAATYGNDPMWIADHLFVPGADMKKDRATLTYPTDSMFRHSISKFSGVDKFPNSTIWRDGVLLINASYINDKIREAVKKVVPAGVKIYFNITNNSGGTGDSAGEYGEITFGEWTLSDWYEIEYNSVINDRKEVAIFSMTGFGKRLRSGRQLLFPNYEIEYESGASTIPIEDNPIFTNTRFGLALPEDLIRTENRQGFIIYKMVKELTKHDYIRININPDSNLVPDIDEEQPQIEIDRDYLPDLSTPKASFSGGITLSGRNVNDIPGGIPEVLPKSDKEILKTDPVGDTSKLIKAFEVKLTDEVTINNGQEKDKAIGNRVRHSIDYFIPGVDIGNKHRGLPKRSSRAIRSGKYAMSGVCTGDIFMIARVEDVNPTDVLYSMNSIANLRPRTYSDMSNDRIKPTYNGHLYEGIEYYTYAKSRNFYLMTTSGLESIDNLINSVITINPDGTESIVAPIDLNPYDRVKCYSLDTFLRDHTPSVEVAIVS